MPKRKAKTSNVSIKHFSKFTQQQIKDYYSELKKEGTIKGSFQSYLNRSGITFFEKFFVETQRSAGKFRVNTILDLAHSGYKRFFIKYK